MLRIIAILLLVSSAYARECINPVISSIVLPPLVYANENGDLEGPHFQKGKLITDSVFQNPIYTKALSIHRTLAEFRHGRIDVLLFELKDRYREQFSVFSNPIGSLEWGVVTRADLNYEWNGFEGLLPLRGGYVKGAPLPDFYLEKLEHAEDFSMIAEVALSILNLLALNRLDYFVAVIHPLKQFSKENQQYALNHLKFHQESYFSVPIHIAISKESPCIGKLNEINEMIAQSRR